MQQMSIKPFIVALYVTLTCPACTSLPEHHLTLTDGIYRMDSDLKKPGVHRNYGGPSECRVTVTNGLIRIEPQDANAAVWFEGKIGGRRVRVSIHKKASDTMLEEYHFVDLWEGEIVANDSVEGTMSMYAGTNLYMSGTWSLKRR